MIIENSILEEYRPIEPFLKWAGGKRWFVSAHADLFPKSYRRYIEPFLGSGAVFFSLQPKDAVISDMNADLIEAYMGIKDDWKAVVKALRQHHNSHCSEYYYTVRESKPRTLISRAARFIYLNRTCWNGLYRVNQKGQFNVPIGTKTNVLYGVEEFQRISDLLQTVRLRCTDFEETINEAKKGDLVFVDPPYTVKHNKNGFIKYNEQIFSWSDQVRLRDSLVKARKRGAYIIATNAHHASIRDIYEGDFELLSTQRNSVIAGSSSNRGKYKEYIILG